LHWIIIEAQRADLLAFEEKTQLPLDPQWNFLKQMGILDRTRYDEVYSQPFTSDDAPARFIELVREVVRDPNLPQLCHERLATVRGILMKIFSDVELWAHPSYMAEDHVFEQMLPAMAAWAPDIGADIIRRQMMNLPDRMNRKPLWWTLRLKTHAVLAEGSVRSALMKALIAHHPDDTEGQVAVGSVLLALFPAMSQSERIEALLDHPLKIEWTELYVLAARLLNEEGKTYLLTHLHRETDPSRLRRICYFLNGTDKGMLSEKNVEPLISILINENYEDRLAAFHLAAIGGIKNLPLELLLSSATNLSDQQSLLPDYASWLLVNGEALRKATYEGVIARLRPRWRAVAAAKRDDFK
jgi:hypothetical protein